MWVRMGETSPACGLWAVGCGLCGGAPSCACRLLSFKEGGTHTHMAAHLTCVEHGETPTTVSVRETRTVRA